MDFIPANERLLQLETSTYFARFLKQKNEPVHYTVLRGHASSINSPTNVQYYVAKYCKKDNFLQFFRDRRKYFAVDKNYYISLRSGTSDNSQLCSSPCEKGDAKSKNDFKKVREDGRCCLCGRTTPSSGPNQKKFVRCSKCQRKEKYQFLPPAANENQAAELEQSVVQYFIQRLEQSKSLMYSQFLDFKRIPDFVAEYFHEKYPRKHIKFFMDHESIFSVSANGLVKLKKSSKDASVACYSDISTLNAWDQEAIKFLVSSIKFLGGNISLQELKQSQSEAPHTIMQIFHSKDSLRSILHNHPNIFDTDGRSVKLANNYELHLKNLEESTVLTSNSLDAKYIDNNSETTITEVNKEDGTAFGMLAEQSKCFEDELSTPEYPERTAKRNKIRHGHQKAQRTNSPSSNRDLPVVTETPISSCSNYACLKFLEELRECGFFKEYHDGLSLEVSVKLRVSRLLWCLDLFCLQLTESDELSDLMAVEYFAGEINRAPGSVSSLLVLQGKLGRAPSNVSTYINRKYPKLDFKDFFLEHKEFKLTSHSMVSVSSAISPTKAEIFQNSKECYFSDAFTDTYCIILETLLNFGIFLKKRGGATVNRIVGEFSLLPQTKTVAKLFDGNNLAAKLKGYFAFFDGIFQTNNDRVTVSNIADICFQFLLEAMLLRITKRELITKGRNAFEGLSDELSFTTFIPSEIYELSKLCAISRKLLERCKALGYDLVSSGFNGMLTRIELIDASATRININLKVAFIRYLVTNGGTVNYCVIPDQLFTDYESMGELMMCCLPIALIEQFESALLTSFGGKVSIKDGLTKYFIFDSSWSNGELSACSAQEEKVSQHLHKNVYETLLRALNKCLKNSSVKGIFEKLISFEADVTTVSVEDSHPEVPIPNHRSSARVEHCFDLEDEEDAIFLLEKYFMCIFENDGIFTYALDSSRCIEASKCLVSRYSEVLDSIDVSPYLHNCIDCSMLFVSFVIENSEYAHCTDYRNHLQRISKNDFNCDIFLEYNCSSQDHCTHENPSVVNELMCSSHRLEKTNPSSPTAILDEKRKRWLFIETISKASVIEIRKPPEKFPYAGKNPCLTLMEREKLQALNILDVSHCNFGNIFCSLPLNSRKVQDVLYKSANLPKKEVAITSWFKHKLKNISSNSQIGKVFLNHVSRVNHLPQINEIRYILVDPDQCLKEGILFLMLKHCNSFSITASIAAFCPKFNCKIVCDHCCKNTGSCTCILHCDEMVSNDCSTSKIRESRSKSSPGFATNQEIGRNGMLSECDDFHVKSTLCENETPSATNTKRLPFQSCLEKHVPHSPTLEIIEHLLGRNTSEFELSDDSCVDYVGRVDTCEKEMPSVTISKNLQLESCTDEHVPYSLTHENREHWLRRNASEQGIPSATNTKHLQLESFADEYMPKCPTLESQEHRLRQSASEKEIPPTTNTKRLQLESFPDEQVSHSLTRESQEHRLRRNASVKEISSTTNTKQLESFPDERVPHSAIHESKEHRLRQNAYEKEIPSTTSTKHLQLEAFTDEHVERCPTLDSQEHRLRRSASEKEISSTTNTKHLHLESFPDEHVPHCPTFESQEHRLRRNASEEEIPSTTNTKHLHLESRPNEPVLHCPTLESQEHRLGRNSFELKLSDNGCVDYAGRVVLTSSTCCLVEICVGSVQKVVYCASHAFRCSRHVNCKKCIMTLTIGKAAICTVMPQDINDCVWVAVGFTNVHPSTTKIPLSLHNSVKQPHPKSTCEIGVQTFIDVTQGESQTVSTGPVLHTNFLPSLV